MSYRIISGDAHVDLSYLPHTLFVDNAPSQLKDKMPHVEDSPFGLLWMADGKFIAQVSKISFGEWTTPSVLHRKKRFDEVGFLDDSSKGIYRPTDPELRIKDQDLDNIDAEVIYGLVFGSEHIQDRKVRSLVYGIYNNWAAEFSKSNPERLACLACLPHDDPQAAAEELRRAATLGLKGAELRGLLTSTPLFHRDWDVLWQASVECNMPISFHLMGNRPKAKRPSNKEYFEFYLTLLLTMAQLDGVEHLSSIILSGACERFPDFKFVLGEAGIGWIPYVIDRMDHEGEGIKGLRIPPSGYWRRQGFSTFQKEGIAGEMLSLVGEDNVIWGNDYPHNDCVWPDSLETIEFNLKGLEGESVRRKVVCENAGKLYGFLH